jgi:uncharacterized membrane protein YiaA
VKNRKVKTAIFIWGVPVLLLLLFLAVLLIAGKGYFLTASLAGLMSASMLLAIFSRKKYFYGLQESADAVTIQHLDRFIRIHETVFNKKNLNIISVAETNWWPGYTDAMLISDDKQSIRFSIISKKNHRQVLDRLEKAL